MVSRTRNGELGQETGPYQTKDLLVSCDAWSHHRHLGPEGFGLVHRDSMTWFAPGYSTHEQEQGTHCDVQPKRKGVWPCAFIPATCTGFLLLATQNLRVIAASKTGAFCAGGPGGVAADGGVSPATGALCPWGKEGGVDTQVHLLVPLSAPSGACLETRAPRALLQP